MFSRSGSNRPPRGNSSRRRKKAESVEPSKSAPLFGGGAADRTLLTGKTGTLSRSPLPPKKAAASTAWLNAFGEPVNGIARAALGPVCPSTEDAPSQELDVPDHLFSPKEADAPVDITANKTAADSLDFLDAYLATQSAPPGDAASTGQSASRRNSIEWCSPIDPVARSSLWFTDDRSEAAALEKALGNTDVPDGTFVVHPNPDPAVGPSIGLAYRCGAEVERVAIAIRKSGLIMPESKHPPFETLSGLVAYYSSITFNGMDLKCRLDPTRLVVPNPGQTSDRGSPRSPRPQLASDADEDATSETPTKLEATQGIRVFLDPAALEQAYYLDDIRMFKARDILTTAQRGDFIVYIDRSSTDSLCLAYVDTSGDVKETKIICVEKKGVKGVRLESEPAESKMYLAVSQLVAALCGPTSTALGAPLRMPPLNGVFGETWMHPRANRDQAGFLLLGQPEGSFVVRCGEIRGEMVPIITYYSGGEILHAVIKRAGHQWYIDESSKLFGSIRELILFLSTESCGSLKSQLVVSNDPLMQSGLQQRPGWLQMSVSKSNALEQVNILIDGSFVVRNSVAERGELVLSYAHHYTISSDRILQFRRPGRVTMYSVESVRDARFPSLTAMVEHFRTAGRGLKCPLTFQMAPIRRGQFTSQRRRTSAPPDSASTRTPLLHNRVSSSASTISSVSSHASGAALPDPSIDYAQHPLVDPEAAHSRWFCMHCTKAEALARVPRGRTGVFVIRPNPTYFATLSVVVNGRIFNAHILDEETGLRLKGASVAHPDLSSLVQHYSDPAQNGLPIALKPW